MKKLAIIISALCLSQLASAQHGKNHQGEHKGKNLSVDEKAKKESEHATQKLSLTAEQAIKWEDAARERLNANEPYRAQMQGSTTPEQRKDLKSKMQANRVAFDQKTEAILTPEQKTKYQDLKKQHKRKGHHGRKGKAAVTD